MSVSLNNQERQQVTSALGVPVHCATVARVYTAQDNKWSQACMGAVALVTLDSVHYIKVLDINVCTPHYSISYYGILDFIR